MISGTFEEKGFAFHSVLRRFHLGYQPDGVKGVRRFIMLARDVFHSEIVVH